MKVDANLILQLLIAALSRADDLARMLKDGTTQQELDALDAATDARIKALREKSKA